MDNQDEKFMKMTIDLAKEMLEGKDEPFSAILVDSNGAVVASGKNEANSKSDPTAHSEMVVIRQYCQNNNLLDLSGYTLYANGEPCAMCSALIGLTKIERLVFCVPKTELNKIKPKTSPHFNLSSRDVLEHSSNKVIVKGPFLEQEGKIIFEKFFK